MLCTTCCLSTDFVGNTNTTNICLILSTIYIFIPVSGCVGRGSSSLLCPGVYNAVKTALHLMHLISIMAFKLGHVSIPKRCTLSPLFLFCAYDSSVFQEFKIFTHLLLHFSYSTLLMTELEFESSASELRM